MAFCTKCGNELNENARFCSNCGTEIKEKNEDKRKMVFDGKIHKCPSCGEILKSFITNCPTCGFELRDVKVSSAVKELALKLEEIESKREEKKKKFDRLTWTESLSKTDEQKISLIRSFVIPNTKEDLYEFLFLSQSNIEIDLYNNTQIKTARLAVSDAWKAKFEQAYQKAKILFKDDDRMIEIDSMYKEIHKSIKNAKTGTWKMIGIIYGVLFGIILIGIISAEIMRPGIAKKETERLEGIVVEIENALESQEYKLALMNAESLAYNGSVSNDELTQKWDIQREYWIDKVIKEAKENGVTLERTIIPEEVNVENETKNEVNALEAIPNGFIDGFNEGLHSSGDEIEKNIEEFKNIMNGISN